MGKEEIFYYLIGIFLFFNLCFVNAGTTNVTECGVLGTANEIYELNTSINSSFDCLNINTTNVTLDCKNYNITFGNSSGGRGVFVINEETQLGYSNATIKNCNLIQNESAINGINGSAIFFGSNSNNSLIYNNSIETYGNETNGITFEDDSGNLNITANNIYTNGTHASGIWLGMDGGNATLENNFIINFGDDTSGIVVGDNSLNITIYNNVILGLGNKTSVDAMGGIFLEVNSSDLNITFNYIFMGYLGGVDYYLEKSEYLEESIYELITGGGYDTAGIWVWGDNLTIDSNIIITFGELGDGIYLNDIEKINITSNFIITLGKEAHGVHSEIIPESARHLFYDNLIVTLGDNSSCIYLNQSSNNNISSNIMGTFGEYSYGIFFNQSHNTTISGNEIFTNESTSYVLYLITSGGEVVYNNLFNTSTSGSGVYIETSDSSDFNTTKVSGTNIVDKTYIGGNYWANVNSSGYSDYCTNWDDDYICDSAYTLVASTDFIDYLPLTLHLNTTGEDDYSGNFGGVKYPLLKPTEEELKNGYTKELSQKWRILFNIENVSHVFKVDIVNKTNVKISISSEIQEATFLIGEERKFDVSGDNNYDVLVRLNSINLSKANFTIQKIYEKISSRTENETEELQNEDVSGDKIGEEKNLTWLLVLIAIIIILIGAGYRRLFRKKYKNK